ncbi:MAG TPA: glycosyltransferase family 39 protein, partial [Dehalococcoidia bacterium]|nr:glycosyltransferase family 39 protein [Dehalococcoidia bacterium]
PVVSYRTLIIVALVLIVPVGLLAPFFSEPFERDEGVFATLAQTILRGDIPYRDAWDHKPPMVAMWYAGSFAVFGESIEAPRIAAAASAALTAVLLFLLARRMYNERVATATALIFGLCYGIPYLQINANSEVFLLLPLVAAFYCFHRAREAGSARWLLAAGALSGLAFMTKQVAMWNFFALAGFLVYEGWRSADWRSTRLNLGIFAGGAVAAMLPFFAYFAVNGALDDFVYAIFTYNELFARQIPLAKRILRMVTIKEGYLALATAFLWVGAAVSIFRMVRYKPGAREVLLLLWIAGCYLGVKTSGRDYPHYYVQLLPGLALLCGVLLYEFRNWRLPPYWRAGLGAALAVAFVVTVGWNARVYALGNVNEIHEEKFPDQLVTEADFEAQDIADYARLTTGPDETIFNLGRESQLYFLAERDPATQFIYDRSFWLDSDTFNEAMTDLRSDPPALIIDSLSVDLVGNRAGDLPAEFTRFLYQNYDYVGRLHYAQIYRLKNDRQPFTLALWQGQFSGVY